MEPLRPLWLLWQDAQIVAAAHLADCAVLLWAKGPEPLNDMLSAGPSGEERLVMPRKPGMPVHVVQRGNNRQAVFYDEQDHRAYLR